MNKNTKTVVIALITAVSIVLIILIVLRPPASSSCIQQPLVRNGANRGDVAQFTAALERASSAKGDAAVKLAFEEAMNAYYAPLNDDHIAYLLCMEAIKCYLEHNTKTSNEIARMVAAQLVQMLDQRERLVKKKASLSGVLTLGERTDFESTVNGRNALIIRGKLGME